MQAMTATQTDWLEEQTPFDRWVHTDLGREVMNKFIRAAYTLWRRGWKHYGAKAIIEGIRWEDALENGPDVGGVKINNNWTSRISRYAERKEPKLMGFFRKRALRF